MKGDREATEIDVCAAPRFAVAVRAEIDVAIEL
jgi:hypothetical protein